MAAKKQEQIDLDSEEKPKLSDFRTQVRNTNRHRPRGMGLLDNVISKEGWQGAITVAANNETFSGSARLEVAQERFGEDSEPIVFDIDGTRPVILRRIDIPTADDPKAIRLGIADNRVAEVNLDYDSEVLAELVQEVDLSDLFFENELETLLEGQDRGEIEGLVDDALPEHKAEGLTYESKYAVAVECESEANQEKIYNTLLQMGYKCKVLTL
jgi:hypothetical protein